MEMNYEESIAYLESLKVFGIQPGLRRIRKMLALMRHPEQDYRTIHVTGTNGKGSVSAMLDSVLRRSGIHTGFFSSPHLADYTERIRIDGEPLAKEDFAAYMEAMKMIADRMVHAEMEHPTQFEMLTALAFYAFSQAGVEYAILEVGMGGTLDSTNVILPEVSVITNVTMEHVERLGGTLKSIAENKAGIIKEGVPVVTAAEGEALAVIRERAEELSSDTFIFGEDFSAHTLDWNERAQRVAFSSVLTGEKEHVYPVSLLGSHQARNAAVAIMTADLLKEEPRITEKSVTEGLRLVSWPGRFERMAVEGLDILLDGAHNRAGIEALRAALDDIYPKGKRLYLLGILADKAIDPMVHMLLRPEDMVIVTKPDSERADSVEDLSAHVREVTDDVTAEEQLETALDLALARAKETGRKLIVCGSLYLIGAVRTLLLERAKRNK